MSSKLNADITFEIKELQDGGSADMAIDGSGTAKTFSWGPVAGEDRLLHRIDLFLLDAGSMSYSSFGSIPALTNGVKVKIKTIEDIVVKDIKNNIDILFAFPQNKMTGSTSTGFLAEEDYYFGSFILPKPVKLIGDNSDKVKIIIQDNLTDIDALCAQICVEKVL